MSEAASPPDIKRYEQACDQAIAMCDGNLRSTIKALIMVNEYLEFDCTNCKRQPKATSHRHNCAEPTTTPPDRRGAETMELRQPELRGRS
jgi:hypothetical protein